MPSRDLRSAREVDLLYELVALLAISGEYFSDVSGGAHLFAEARAVGLCRREVPNGDRQWFDG
jgi:hypothetical protein